MEFRKNINIENLHTWEGGKDTFNTIKEHGKLNELEHLIDEFFIGSTPTETEINDLLWFDDEMIFKHLGINEDEEELENEDE
jgi:hypothetical protein